MAPKEYFFKNNLFLLTYGLLTAYSSTPSTGPSAGKIVALNQQNSGAQIPAVELIGINDTTSEPLRQVWTNQSFAQLGNDYVSAGAINADGMLGTTV